MHTFTKPFRCLRSGFFCLLLSVLFCIPLAGQFKFREPPNRQTPEALPGNFEEHFWDWFVSNRAAGIFEIEGLLTHRPAGSPSTTFQFLMKGDWQPGRQETEITLVDSQGMSIRRHVVVGNSQARIVCSDGDTTFQDETWHNPVIDEFPTTWMDLLMPYFDWEGVTYLGPDRLLGRPAHRFVIVNPDPVGLPAKVIVTLDADYAAVLRTDMLDADNRVIRRMRVGGIKKFDGEWMFSELNWENRLQRSSIRLRVSSFKTNSP